MKRKQIEKTEPIKTKKRGEVVSYQTVGDTLILNLFLNKILYGRYCIVASTGEHACWEEKEGWTAKKLSTFITGESHYYNSYRMQETTKKIKFNNPDDQKEIEEFLGNQQRNMWSSIDSMESEYSTEKRWSAEERRQQRLKELMNKVPAVSERIREWIIRKAAGEDYAFSKKGEKRYGCTNCGAELEEAELKRTDGESKIRHNDMVTCPKCKKPVQVKKRNKRMAKKTGLYLIQPAGEETSVIRYFDVGIVWEFGSRVVNLEEGIRIMAYKEGGKKRSKKGYEIYYQQYWRGGFDKGNTANWRAKAGYLYEGEIRGTLENTAYADAGRLLEQLSETNIEINYNNLLIGDYLYRSYSRTAEYLFKGRFKRLLYEMAEDTNMWAGYYGKLNITGKSLESVFGINDKQKINRIRDMDGGESVVMWMRWSEENEKKIPQDTLTWLIREKIKLSDINRTKKHMNPQQIQNYIVRQKEVSYPQYTCFQILEQWEDYLQMCEAVGKRMDDEMVYRPRELKRRHDEVVTDINQMKILKEMEGNKEYKESYSKEMREKYPEAESILKEIKERYEYESEEYFIQVPETLMQIVEEGQALHHCAGSSERYFDRIENRETYICFLRRQSARGIPYYTIEIEPGGTIRQHRSYLDEEPGIDEIRGFLKEWQQVLKKRLTKEDKRLARISEVKRNENIEELKRKKNLRVLKALEEDFLENVIEETA